MVVGSHCDLIPPPSSRRSDGEPAFASVVQIGQASGDFDRGGPSLDVCCEKYVRERKPNFTECGRVSGNEYITAHRYCDESPEYLRAIPFRFCTKTTTAVQFSSCHIGSWRHFSRYRMHLHRVHPVESYMSVLIGAVSKEISRESGRSQLREGHVHLAAAMQRELAPRTYSNCAGTLPLSPRTFGRARLVSGRGLFDPTP
jgi:hypothetical protein